MWKGVLMGSITCESVAPLSNMAFVDDIWCCVSVDGASSSNMQLM